MNYWILSPNVYNNNTEANWKKAIVDLQCAFIGYDTDHTLGELFHNGISIGDIVLIAQGQNSGKKFFFCGVVDSKSVWEHKKNTPGVAQNRKLKHVINKENLDELNLDFIGSTWGASKQPAALYKLKPDQVPKDKIISEKLWKAIKEIKDIDTMQEKINVLKFKKQIILQGPPGTGKTFTAKKMAEKLIGSDLQKDQVALIQFHPSYTYEDFVRGISVITNGTQLEYKTENKIFTEFADKALTNFKNSKKEIEEFSEQIWANEQFEKFKEFVQDEIDEKGKFILNKTVNLTGVDEDAFRYCGNGWAVENHHRMKFEDILQMYLANINERKEIKNLNSVTGSAKQHASYYYIALEKFKENIKELKPVKPINIKPELKNFVLIIDEINRANLPSVLGELIYALEYRNEAVESMYAIDKNKKITIPENLYIIGTMNTADRSVGHIDYAIRRRFAFIDVLPNIEIIKNDKARNLFLQVEALFVKEIEGKIMNAIHLAPDFNFKDVQLGHSYFLLKSTGENEQMEELKMKLEYEIKPVLREYVNDGLLLESATQIIENISL